MRIVHLIKNFIFNPQIRFSYLTELGLTKWMSDEEFLKKEYKLRMGYSLDLNNPTTYNEKIQWLKLYDRNDQYTMMVDKYLVKEYIKSLIGEEYVIPTLGVWDSFDDIDFSKLPNQFVLKCTHDSGGLVICKDKSTFSIANARNKINKCLRRKYYYIHREWPYKNVKPRIIAEEYMEDSETKELRDYKFFTFNGVPRAVFIATDRQKADEETKFDFYDMDFTHLNIKNGHPNADVKPEKPLNFEKMKQFASILGSNIPHVRVDFYEVNGKLYFGELTFSHWSGMVPFEPIQWDYTFGEWIDLSSLK